MVAVVGLCVGLGWRFGVYVYIVAASLAGFVDNRFRNIYILPFDSVTQRQGGMKYLQATHPDPLGMENVWNGGLGN